MKFNRREFLHTAAGFGIASLLPGCSGNQSGSTNETAAAVETPAAVAIPTRLIPSTSESLPVVGFGSTKAVRLIPENGPGEIRSVIQTLLENGGRVIDTSYREEELDRPFGEILQDPAWKDKLFVSTKINTMGKEAGIAQIEQTERLFNRHPADLIQVESLRDVDVHLETLHEWKDNGRTRYVGITTSSSADHERMEEYMNKVPLDFIQVNYSIPESGAAERVLPLAKEKGLGVLINSPFMNGEWFSLTAGKELPGWAAEIECTSWAQIGLKFILANQAITCVLTETTSPDHLVENLQSSLGKMPDEELQRRMKSDVLALI